MASGSVIGAKVSLLVEELESALNIVASGSLFGALASTVGEF